MAKRSRAETERVAQSLLPETVDRVRALGDRLHSLEDSVKGLGHVLLHDFIHWRCEQCGHANRLLRYLAPHLTWTCEGCGCVPKEDYRQFHLYRK